MSLPAFLLFEIRHAFKTCARSPLRQYSGQLNTSRLSCRPPNSKQFSSNHRAFNKSTPRIPSSKQSKTNSEPADLTASSNTKDLVPQDAGKKAVGSGRKVNVPLRVIPKAELTPKVSLTPKERLHIEMLTRRSPKRTTTKTYKERLLIYHLGESREKVVILLKFAGIVFVCATTAVIVPAYYSAGSSPWLCAAILTAGLIPLLCTHLLTSTWTTRIFLHLPPQSRTSPQAAMEYSKNLPSSAAIDIEFLRWIPTPGRVTAYLADLEPITTSKFQIQPATFRYKDHRADSGPWYKPNPTRFWVRPESSKGKAARVVVPGIWDGVYRRLAGVEVGDVSRWKR